MSVGCLPCTELGVVAKSTIVLEVKPWDSETGICIHTTGLDV